MLFGYKIGRRNFSMFWEFRSRFWDIQYENSKNLAVLEIPYRIKRNETFIYRKLYEFTWHTIVYTLIELTYMQVLVNLAVLFLWKITNWHVFFWSPCTYITSKWVRVPLILLSSRGMFCCMFMIWWWISSVCFVVSLLYGDGSALEWRKVFFTSYPARGDP